VAYIFIQGRQEETPKPTPLSQIFIHSSLPTKYFFYRRFILMNSRQLGHERPQYIVIHVLPLGILLLLRVSVQTPNLALVHAKLQQLMGTVFQREVEGVEEYAVGPAFDGRD
jgi:hypothetical protein